MSDVRGTSGGSRAPGDGPADADPRWDQVPFEVSCGRCGADLRGRSEPVCPQCELAFEWGDVIPLEDLRCAECGYHLKGLTRPRCPECGTSFEWSDPLGAARARRNRLIEHWRSHPVIRTLLRTWWLAAFRPRRLWAEFSIHDPPKVGPLVVFILLQWIVFAVGWPAAAAVVDPVMNGLARWVYTPPAQPAPQGGAPVGAPPEAGPETSDSPDLNGESDDPGTGDLDDGDSDGLADADTAGAAGANGAAQPQTPDLTGRRGAGRVARGPVTFVYRWRPRGNFFTFLAFWYLATFASFQLFIVTKRRYRMRWQQILRVFAHATAFTALCTALWCLLEGVTDSTWLITTPSQRLMNTIYARLMQGVFVLGVGMTWLYLWLGFRCYLKVRYGWAAAAACIVLGNRLAFLVMIYWPQGLRLPLPLPF
ncbi:MAG TPA: hypothetical protein VM243_13220 [Phycisphaerae bacterium]|nr:hypothetical protein [Phycisphaerae bacterium]